MPYVTTAGSVACRPLPDDSLRIKRLTTSSVTRPTVSSALLPTRERLRQADLEKLQANLGGVKNMQRVPDAMFVIDLKTEAIAVREAQRLRIPIIGLVDTTATPTASTTWCRARRRDPRVHAGDPRDRRRALRRPFPLPPRRGAGAPARPRAGPPGGRGGRRRREAEEQARSKAEEQSRGRGLWRPARRRPGGPAGPRPPPKRLPSLRRRPLHTPALAAEPKARAAAAAEPKATELTLPSLRRRPLPPLAPEAPSRGF